MATISTETNGKNQPVVQMSRLRGITPFIIKRTAAIFVLGVLFSICMESFAQSGERVYQTYCGGCHGTDLDGTAAGSSLLEPTLKHGHDRNSILHNIRNGILGTTMVSWESALTEADIEAVTDYILNARKAPDEVKPVEKALTFNTQDYKLKIEKVVTEGLEAPWGIEFVDADRALVTGNKGELYWVINGKAGPEKITGLPHVYAYDMYGGMMDLALDPEYSKNGWVYFAFSHTPTGTSDKNAPGMTKVVRGKIKDNQWVKQETLFEAPDSILVEGGMRWGSRLLFDKEGYLYFSIGDMQQAIQSGNNPQLPHRAEGKIFRIHPDGSIPKDNPHFGKDGTLQGIYAWGTRNVQGIAQHPVTGEIYFTDHGPKGGDEVNRLKKGGNYGWPVITYGVNYDGSTITHLTHEEGMEQPLTYWDPSIAVCAAQFVTGNKYPKWQNNLLVTALKDEEIRRLVVDGDQILSQEVILKGHGRVRDVKIGPDGYLYVLTNSPDALLRITPMD